MNPVITALIRNSTTSAMHRRHEAAHELDQPGADQVAHAFDVAHDARHQHAALVRVVIGDRKSSDVLLYFLAQFRDQALRRPWKEAASA